MTGKYAYRDLRGLGSAITILLWLQIIVYAGYLVASIGFIRYLLALVAIHGREARIELDADLAPLELWQLAFALPLLLLTIALIIMICRWIYLAGRNLRQLGAQRLAISAGMAVGWYFVPFANLVMPFQAMKEIWLASHDPVDWRPQGVGLLAAWWTVWLVSAFVGNVSLMAATSADTHLQLAISEMIGLGATVLNILLAWVFIHVIAGVQRAQQASASRLEGADVMPGPGLLSV